jgi:hypothetical protein
MLPSPMEFSTIELHVEPTVSDALLHRLSLVFPAGPSKGMSHRELDQYLGQREVLDYLQRLHDADEAGEGRAG